MSKLNSVEGKAQEPIRKIAHPAIGEIYCLNEPEARATLHETWDDKLYFREGVSILPGDIVFDVGANIGVFTLCAAKQGAHIYAYEPIPPTFELLQHNIHLHGFDNIAHARNIGLSDRAEERISASSVWIECKFDTLSGVIAQEKIQSIGLLKLDAEFADWEILNGVKAKDWNRIRQVAMEVHGDSSTISAATESPLA